MLQAVVITSAGLLINSAVPLARSALVDTLSVVTAAVGAVALVRYHVDALWVLGAGALASLVATLLSITP
jgi:hypothetical protein